jgi:MFS family permease
VNPRLYRPAPVTESSAPRSCDRHRSRPRYSGGLQHCERGPAAEVVSRAYGVHLGTVGFLTTAFVTHLAMQIPGGKLVDQRGARNLGMVALAVILLGNILALLVDSFALGLVGRHIAGIGTGVGFIAGTSARRLEQRARKGSTALPAWAAEASRSLSFRWRKTSHFAVYASTVSTRCSCRGGSPVAWVPAARSRFTTPEA